MINMIDGKLCRQLINANIPDYLILKWDNMARNDPTISIQYIETVAKSMIKLNKAHRKLTK